MVLTEAFAAGTPVVASDIAGYRDVVTDGADGLLVPRGDATRLAEVLRDLALDPARAARLGAGAGRSAERYAWPRVAAEVVEAYEDARSVPAPAGARERVAVRIGTRPADRRGPPAASGCRSLEPPPPGRAAPGLRVARRGALGRRRRSPRSAARRSRSSGSASARSAGALLRLQPHLGAGRARR